VTTVADDTGRLTLEQLYEAILVQVGEDVTRQGLLRTPVRAANALRELTQGYAVDVQALVNEAIFEEEYDEMVVVKDIEFYSLCEHHLIPFFGHCHVAYIPDGRIIGLSKIPRIVDAFAQRLQLQERLTTQIAQVLDEVLRPRGVAVIMEAIHLCMTIRGVEKQNSRAVTSALLGIFREHSTRSELLDLLGAGRLPTP
jgi:GTP cyclohydrolase I